MPGLGRAGDPPGSWCALGIVATVALVVTGSRGAWLGAAAGLAFFGLLAWLDRGRHGRSSLSLGRRGRLALVGAFVVGGLAVLLFGPTLLTRLTGGDAGRIELWEAAWSMFTGHPISGVGPGAWPGMRPLTPISDANLAVLYTSHSIVLQVLAELGVIGALAAGWLAATVAWTCWRSVRTAATTMDATLRAACLASLAAFAVHSLVDTQIHIPAVALMLMLLVARLDPVRGAVAPDLNTIDTTAVPRPSRRAAIAMALPVALGAALLVPIDVAMIRAQFGNGHLDRGETAAALADFDAAVGLHDLPVYRLGQAIARDWGADRPGAIAALERMAEREPFTFVASATASLHAVLGASEAASNSIADAEAPGPYDPTATLQLAIQYAQTFEDKVDHALAPLAAAMTAVPSLIHSAPPADVFSDGTWSTAQAQALAAITARHPPSLPRRPSRPGCPMRPARPGRASRTRTSSHCWTSCRRRSTVGTADIDAAMAILRANPDDQFVQLLVWDIGFVAKSQPTIDAVARLYGVVFLGSPQPPMEFVIDGIAKADWSMRLPRYPMAARRGWGRAPVPAGPRHHRAGLSAEALAQRPAPVGRSSVRVPWRPRPRRSPDPRRCRSCPARSGG